MIVAQEGSTLATLPNPTVDFGADWVYHTWIQFMSDSTDAIERGWATVSIDNMAMRKLGEHMELFVVYSSLSAVNTHWTVSARVLCLLP